MPLKGDYYENEEASENLNSWGWFQCTILRKAQSHRKAFG